MAKLFSGDDEADAKIKGAERSAAAQTAAQKQSLAAQEKSLARSEGLINPFAASESQAFDKLRALSGSLGNESQAQAFQDFQESPEVAFLREQGLRGVENQASARGGLGGGNRLKALSEFNQGIALQNFNQTLGRLQGVGQLDLGIAGQLSGLENARGNAQSGAATNQGNIQANRFTTRGNIQAQEKADQAQGAVDLGVGIIGGLATGGLGSLGGFAGGLSGSLGGLS